MVNPFVRSHPNLLPQEEGTVALKVPRFLRAGAKKKPRRRLERFDIILTVLLAGWAPTILMLLVSYTTLQSTLESKILRDRQTFVQLLGHLVDDDLARTANVIGYYQTLPNMERIFEAPNADTLAQQWIGEKLFSYPRIDGMFMAAADGKLLGSLPATPDLVGQPFHPERWKDGADARTGAFVSAVNPRPVDGRMVTDIVGAVRTRDGHTVGYIGASILIERIGRRLSTISFADRAVCQIIDQDGFPIFASDFKANVAPAHGPESRFISEMEQMQTGHLTRDGTIYSFDPLESAKWLAVVHQPQEIAYQPIHDLMRKIRVPAVWLVIGTALVAIFAGRFYRRQTEAARRIEREVTFNEKILANMPIGIALVDPETGRFLHVNDAFAQMATQLGQLPGGLDIGVATYDQIKIVPPDAIENVLGTGTPFQMIEQPFADNSGATRFLNVNLLRLLDSKQHIQGVLYLVEEKTRDMTLRNELLGANAAKDQFLALLSHELRNPLSPVIAMVEELDAQLDSAETRRALNIIRRNVELEARLIDDLLDITRISKGKLKLGLEPVSIHNVLQRALEICRDDISQKGLRVDLKMDAREHFVHGDSARLQQIFWNLIKNSVKFTAGGGGRITLATANPQPGQIEIRTTDTGIGIEPEKVSKIFNAFEQGQSSITRKFGGLGLGLAISKAMVTAHGGTISAFSAGKDRGATFTIRLATIATPTKLELDLQPNGHGAPALPARSGRAPRLLVVDDHPDTCTGMKMILERRGYDITVAHTADQASEKARKQNFDLLISDIGLPDRSGYELMQELGGHGLRGIALSGFGMESDINRARESGFSEHLTKPINFDRLEKVIRELLGNEAGESDREIVRSTH
jgi:signal transduction histidine kinase/ActR/RegA family two-component response regulator